ncbi:MAG: NAD(P)-dependent malic enzyme [Dethiobacteria bacterium]
MNKDELLAKATKPLEAAGVLHPYYEGKVEICLKAPVHDYRDFAIWYTPGVAASCRAIEANKEEVYRHTNKANIVAVVSDGTRVLGLGDIGPEAALPVMEGKALLFKYLGGVDAFPVCLDTRDPEEIIRTVKLLQPSFGGINLEDIASPKCFYILERLRAECHIPVWHDDQQGTACVTLAGLFNALKIVGKELQDVKIAMVGAGAANIANSRLLLAAGVPPKNLIICDSKGILHKGREDIQDTHREKLRIMEITNAAQKSGGIPEALKGADVLIALSRPGPGTIKKEWISGMAKDAIVFACANPIPEIWPWEAREAGAAIVSTGRSDFPNQVNNSLCFPAIFRGVLDVRAKTITDTMCIAAAKELAACAAEGGLNPEKILPAMDNREVYPRVATATALQAIAEGVAAKVMSREEIYTMALQKIKRAQDQTRILLDSGIVQDYRKSPGPCHSE